MSLSSIRTRAAIVAFAALVLFPFTVCAQSIKPGKLDVELDAVRPGLVASYRSLIDQNATLMRIRLQAGV